MPYQIAPCPFGLTYRFCVVPGWLHHDLGMTWDRHASVLHVICKVLADCRSRLEVCRFRRLLLSSTSTTSTTSATTCIRRRTHLLLFCIRSRIRSFCCFVLLLHLLHQASDVYLCFCSWGVSGVELVWCMLMFCRLCSLLLRICIVVFCRFCI
jgi:hypothetical protein